jgi:hypothetical protein
MHARSSEALTWRISEMKSKFQILIFGASYGSLLATKLILAGHGVHLVCLPVETAAINSQGTCVRLPIRGRHNPVEIYSRTTPGKLTASEPSKVQPSNFDLAVLAMQEPQYRAPEVRELLKAVARAGLPTLSIMNMPPLPYLVRIPGLNADDFRHCYTDSSVWDDFAPALMTLASPDPQAFRPPEEPLTVLQVTLPTNFKAARFASDQNTAILRRLQSDIEAIRFDSGNGAIELPVKL